MQFLSLAYMVIIYDVLDFGFIHYFK